MYFYSETIVRNILLTFTLMSIVLGWLSPNISCLCANASSTISINQKLENLESSCCMICKELRNCSCCTIDEDQVVSISNNMNAIRCQCTLHSNGLPGSKMLISEIPDSRNLKPQLSDQANFYSLNTNLNQVSLTKIDNYSFKIKDSTSLLLIYCQLNI